MRHKLDPKVRGRPETAASSGRSPQDEPGGRRANRLSMFFRDLGPGLITGCADDDPSGIATYAIAGTHIHTARQAAEALRPLAGSAAYWLFTLGLISTGMLGVPVLAGSCAYAIAEAGAWRGSLEKKPHGARRFYAVLAIAMIGGLAIDLAAVVNGALAPPLILLVVLLTSNPRVMGGRVNSHTVRILGWTTFILMSAATVGMLVF
jgi:Mn2+/Fe2+ NRAMP family transporter